jgi:hypothetical protein
MSIFSLAEVFSAASARFPIAPQPPPLYRKRSMGQQHRVRAKRKRRRAYLDRKKAALKAIPREMPKAKAKKQTAAAG